jgi:hypothetical protein
MTTIATRAWVCATFASRSPTLQATVDGLAADGYGLVVGGIGQHENIWRVVYVRGPEGIVVSVAERIG